MVVSIAFLYDNVINGRTLEEHDLRLHALLQLIRESVFHQLTKNVLFSCRRSGFWAISLTRLILPKIQLYCDIFEMVLILRSYFDVINFYKRTEDEQRTRQSSTQKRSSL